MQHIAIPDEPTLSPFFGWPVETTGAQFTLRTGQNLCAIVVPRAIGDRALSALRAVGGEGPVVGIRRGAERHVFIAEADAIVDGTDIESRGGQLLDAGDRIELPSPADVAGEVFWIVPPLPSRRWLPTLSTLLWALPMTSAALRSHHIGL